MRRAAGYTKLFIFIIFSLTGSLIFLFLDFLNRLLGRPPERLQVRFMRIWAHGASCILNIHVKSSGIPPSPPFMLVCNHLSYLDIVPLYLHLDCTFVAKKEVRNWPLLGYMVSKMGVLFIDRSRKADVLRVNSQLKGAINSRQGVVLFPEGTSSGGESVLPFKSPLLEAAASESIPVFTACIRYQTAPADPPARDSVCFFGARHTFLQHVILMSRNRRIECEIAFHSDPVEHTDRKRLSELLHRQTNELFQRMGEGG
ncbi:MAG: 1-acyl-sn-glycerol-3-phosphate acyltransferase [Balneolaceae bacterium]|nr:MAG: 1-acyl-sn-glycerol-3-phosphate acyltransferase [Balneolaceae bacterium]